MSFAAVAGAAITVGGGLISGAMSGEAGEQLEGGSLAARKLYGDAQPLNDKLLADAEARNQKEYNPWSRLGGQATKGLSRYLGYVPEYGVAKPKKVTASELRSQWEKKHPGKKSTLDFEARAAKKTKNQLAKWTTERDAFKTEQRGTEDFGAYFKGYGVEEPTYTPYKDYEQFTDAHLKADPLYETELNENVGAWDRSAASRGSLMSGNTVAGLREITAGGIGRARDRHIQDYDEGRGNYLEDYGIGHDEWEGGYTRDYNERERKYNALTGMSGVGLQVADRRSGLRTGTAQGRVQNSQWATQGAAGAEMSAADARASGAINQGNAYGNAFNNIGSLGLLYGLGAFDGREGDGTRGNPRDDGGNYQYPRSWGMRR